MKQIEKKKYYCYSINLENYYCYSTILEKCVLEKKFCSQQKEKKIK